MSSRQDVEVALRDWFAARLGAPDVAIEDLHRHDEGFSWRTYTLDVRWRDEEGAERVHGYAARVEPEDGLLAPYDIEYQYGVHRLVSEHSTVPIPKLGWLELDPSVLDMPFYVMDRVRAVVPVQWRPDDPEIFPTDAAREAIGLAFIDVQAAIAATDWRRFGGGLFADPGTPEQSAAAQVEYWTDYYEQARLVELPILREAIAWLRANVCCSGQLALCHGDYRIGNFMLDGTTIVAVLDWEIAHISDPIEDLAYAGLPLFRGRDPRLSHLIEPAAAFARYEARTGITVDPEVFHFWTVLGLLKAAASHVRACRAFQDGRAGDLRLAAMDHRTHYLLAHVVRELDLRALAA